MSKPLNQKAFFSDAKTVALELLKSNIVSTLNNEKISLEIEEIEIYEGFKDKASHAFCGKTKRNELMFEKGGIFYIYLVYGMHLMLNVIVDKKNYPAAILIRKAGKYDGPGKLSKALGINMNLNGEKIKKENGIWFEKKLKNIKIKKTPRVGINYAGDFWKNAPMRFIKLK